MGVKVKMAPHISVKYFIAFLIIHVAAVELDSDVPSVVQLAHSFGPNGEFEPRGQINVRSLRAGSFSVQQASLLYESALSDIITIHVDLLVNIYGVSLSTSL